MIRRATRRQDSNLATHLTECFSTGAAVLLSAVVAACSSGAPAGSGDGVGTQSPDGTGTVGNGGADTSGSMPTGTGVVGAAAGTGATTEPTMGQGGGATVTGSTVAPDQVVTADQVAVDCTTLQRPPTPFRRLTRFEYDNTVQNLLSTLQTPSEAFPPDEVSEGFTNNGVLLTVSSLHAERYMEAAEALAAEAVTNLTAILPCDPATAGEEACATQFAQSFGRVAFRRELEPEDVAVLMTAYAAGNSFQKGIEVMIRAVLQSPHFLFRVELTAGAGSGLTGMVRVNAAETATRLSYLLWGSGPDAALLDAAAAGSLSTPEQVAAKAREMLTSPKARGAITEFYRQWMELTRLPAISKDTTTFPLWGDEMRAAMQDEADALIEQFVWGAEPTLTQLLSAPVGLASGPLAQLYGVPATDAVVTLPAAERSGILTMPGFLSVQSHPDQTSPVLRGQFVRTRILCDTVPPPPDTVDASPPDPTEGATARIRFSAHSASADCAVCHQLMDPLGFAFETYDALGAYRTTDGGQALDLSGEFISTDVDGTFNGVQEMAQKLSQSTKVKNCFATQWYRFSAGRPNEAGDACSLTPLQEAFAASGGNLMELIVGMTQTEAFLYRRAATEVSQ